jgi:hypothetical protein
MLGFFVRILFCEQNILKFSKAEKKRVRKVGKTKNVFSP